MSTYISIRQLIISAFKKSPESVSGTLISPWNESKGKLLFFTFIHLSIKSVLCAISCELLSNPKWLKVVLWGLGRGGCQKSRLIFIITITDSIQHRPIFLLPLQGQQQRYQRGQADRIVVISWIFTTFTGSTTTLILLLQIRKRLWLAEFLLPLQGQQQQFSQYQRSWRCCD